MESSHYADSQVDFAEWSKRHRQSLAEKARSDARKASFEAVLKTCSYVPNASPIYQQAVPRPTKRKVLPRLSSPEPPVRYSAQGDHKRTKTTHTYSAEWARSNIVKVVTTKRSSRPMGRRSSVSTSNDKTRRSVWGAYIGQSITAKPCLLCGRNIIVRNTNSGWQAAHIAPQALDKHNHQEEGTNRIILQVPSCPSCNNRMDCMNLFDYLYTNGEHKRLRFLLWKWWQRYPNGEAKKEQKTLSQLLYFHFGAEYFPNGGGIENQQVYHMADKLQLKKLEKKTSRARRKMQKYLTLAELVTDNINKRDEK